MFRNTLIANDKYPVRDCVNLPSAIEMQLPLKPTIFFDFFLTLLQSTSNLKDFEKQDDSHSYFISEIRHCERVG